MAGRRATKAIAAALLALPAAGSPPAPPLAGRFTLILSIDAAAGPTRTLSGSIVLDPVAIGAPPTSTGRYRIPFGPGDPAPTSGPVMARQGGGDSVWVVLNPSARGPRAELLGRRAPIGIEGRWRWIGGGASGGGRFTIRPD